MDTYHIIIPLVALLASLLTFFSGFGLGTMLTPAFVLFFPIETAIALTAVVHLLNNIFKTTLVGRFIKPSITLKFGITAFAGALVGALVLAGFSGTAVIHSYSLGDAIHEITVIKLVLAVIIIGFALFELVPGLKELQFGQGWLWLGGLLSGFFGGLSGHQGALRSAFLIKFGLSKEAFIATGISIALIIDLTRIPVYLQGFLWSEIQNNLLLLMVTILAAFTGAIAGRMLLRKVTINLVQTIVGSMIIVIGVLLGTGLI